MQNLKIKLGVLVLVILIGGGIFIVSRSPSVENSETSASYETTNPGGAENPMPTPTTKTYSMSQVAVHKNAQGCWTIIRGNVYDLTPWISEHPGGSQAILSLCGIDGTSAFTNQHGGQGNPEAELKSLIIGKLQ